MSLKAVLSGRVVNRTQYSLVPVDGKVEQGRRVRRCEPVGPLEDKIAFEYAGASSPPSDARGHCSFAILDSYGADTLSRLILRWDVPTAANAITALSAEIQGRESAAIECTVPQESGKAVTAVYTLAYRI